MKKSKFASLAGIVALGAISALGTGCIISSDDGDSDRGVFHATWDVNGDIVPAACDEVGADKVSFLFTASNGQGFDELFDCFDFAGQTDPLPIDDYTYVASLLQCPNTASGCPGGVVLSKTNALSDTFLDCPIGSGTCIVDLPQIDFRR
jgi:hypothetical protein